MTATVQPGFPIVVAVDGTPGSDLALNWAVNEAVAHDCGLTLAHVAGARDRGADALARAVSAVAFLAPGLPVHQVRRAGPRHTVLLSLTGEARLLAMGSRGRGAVGSHLLGSTSVAVSRRADCPVVVVRGDRLPAPARRGVLVGADATADSQAVLDFAFTYADLHGLPLTVLHSRAFGDPSGSALVPVGQDDESHRVALAESLAGLSEMHPDVAVEFAVVRDMPEMPLLHRSEHTDLVVVGRHQRTPGQQLMFGPLSVRLVEHARGSVAIVPVGPLRRGD